MEERNVPAGLSTLTFAGASAVSFAAVSCTAVSKIAVSYEYLFIIV